MSLFGALLHDLTEIVQRNLNVSPEDMDKLQELQAKAMQVAHKAVSTFDDASEDAQDFLNQVKDAFDEKVREVEEELGNRIIELENKLKDAPTPSLRKGTKS